MAKFRIKNILATKGMTIKGLADKMGITPQALGSMINEKSGCNVSSLEKIAHALDVPVSSLFADYLSSNSGILICPHCGARIDIITGTPK